ncbi:MAG: PQQ-binding-like beta-propeller repeat protein, partial [Desulfobacterota bacterium]|nr:PQQ-binding-like beta-propeller repeat protein [Thermodesulfobacteriota bacterium]
MLKRVLFVLLLQILCVDNLSAQLADAPWPKFHKDEKNSGFTSNFGTQVGKLKWKFVTGGPVTSSPIIDNNGIVYFGSADNYFYAVSAETGAVQWSYLTGGAIELCSPALDENGVVYIGSNDGYLYAFDTKTINPKNKTTWKEKWKFKTNGAISSSPTIHPNGSIIIASNDGYIYSISSSGALNWKQYVGATWCSPALDVMKNQLYIGVWEPQDSPITTVEYEIDNNTIT